MTTRSAGRLSLLARRMRMLPVTRSAMSEGSLSGGQVDAIVAQLDEKTVALFADAEEELVPYLAPLTVAGVSRAMAAWKGRAVPEPDEREEPERSLHLSQTLDDRYVLDGSLDAEGGATVAAALRLATTEDVEARRTPTTRRADALIEICRFSFSTTSRRAAATGRTSMSSWSSMTW